MIQAIKELVERRDLLYIMTWREITVKYKQSIMGMLWAVLMPALIICAGLVVRYAFAMVSGKSLVLLDLTSVAVKAAPWAFFVASIRFGTSSLVSNTNLVTKIYLPRLVFPLAAVFSQFFDFLIAAAVELPVLDGSERGMKSSSTPMRVPLIRNPSFLTAALAIMFSAASLFFRDVKYLVEVLLTFAIFFTPVFYESALFGFLGRRFCLLTRCRRCLRRCLRYRASSIAIVDVVAYSFYSSDLLPPSTIHLFLANSIPILRNASRP